MINVNRRNSCWHTPSRPTMMSTFPYTPYREREGRRPHQLHAHATRIRQHPPQPVAQDISRAHFEATAAAVHPFSRSPLAM